MDLATLALIALGNALVQQQPKICTYQTSVAPELHYWEFIILYAYE
jgi:hypothetical protein